MGQAQGKEFPYSAVEQLSTSPNGLWSFHSGTQKDGSPVGIFQFNQASDKPMGKIRADNAIKKSKIMRHPNILRFVDSISLETQDLMVMEEAIPLSAVLSEIVSHPDWIAYGLKQIADALCFLNTQCNMVHGNVCISSVFVTPAGEWKLSGLELLSEQGSSHLLASNQQSVPTILPLPIPPECKSTNWKGPNAAFDAYQFAVLIYQVFNPQSDTKNISTKNIPKSLLASFQQLIDENPRKRPSIKDVVTGPFFCNALTSACDFIDNISLKEAPEKEIFLKKLTSQIDGFPERICKLKILPALMTALDFGSASSQVIGPILKIGKLLSAEEYTEQIAPNVAKWFSSPDKTLRVNLLQNLSSFAEFLTPALVNEKIFPNIVGGFIDPNPAMRELTIISIVHLVPKIDKKSLDGTLLKALAKMQVDREPGIRANATICLSKISSHLPPESRKRSLIPGFSRALQDPFVHTRSAGVMAFAATQQYYDKEDIAKRIIPALSVCCIDPQEKVRKNALNTIKSFVSKLEFISENPGEDVTSKESAGMFSWAVSSLSKFYPSKTVETKVENDTENKQKQPEKSVSTSSINTTQALNDDIEDPYESPQENLEADGWDDEDDWGDFEAVTPNKLELAKVKKETKKVAKKETTKPKETHVAPIVEDGWNDDGGWEDFDEAELNEQEPEAPAIDAEGGWGNDGWDDEDDWGDFNSKTPSKLDVAKQKKQKSAKSD